MTGSTEAKKQAVWIIRYGLTKFPLKENEGPYDSPIHPVEGVEHAKCIASRLAADPDPPDVVLSSPFLRTTETGHIVAEAAGCSLCIEGGLTEWLTPSLLVDPQGVKTDPKAVDELSELFARIDTSYKSKNPVVEKPEDDSTEGTPPCFVETEETLLKRCATTLDRILTDFPSKNVALVSHAPCDQAMAFYLEGAPSPTESKLGPWPLGGVTKFSKGSSDSAWTIKLYGDTEHMPGIYKPGIKKWSLPSFEK